MHRTAILVATLLIGTAFLPVAIAHQNRIPGAIVLNEDVDELPRCYIFSAPIAAGEGPNTAQYFVEANDNLTGGVPNGTGPTSTRTATLDRTIEGFTGDLSYAPDEVPLKETVVGEPSGLQHHQPRFNVASEDPEEAAENPDEQLAPEAFADVCLAP